MKKTRKLTALFLAVILLCATIMQPGSLGRVKAEGDNEEVSVEVGEKTETLNISEGSSGENAVTIEISADKYVNGYTVTGGSYTPDISFDASASDEMKNCYRVSISEGGIADSIIKITTGTLPNIDCTVMTKDIDESWSEYDSNASNITGTYGLRFNLPNDIADTVRVGASSYPDITGATKNSFLDSSLTQLAIGDNDTFLSNNTQVAANVNSKIQYEFYIEASEIVTPFGLTEKTVKGLNKGPNVSIIPTPFATFSFNTTYSFKINVSEYEDPSSGISYGVGNNEEELSAQQIAYLIVQYYEYVDGVWTLKRYPVNESAKEKLVLNWDPIEKLYTATFNMSNITLNSAQVVGFTVYAYDNTSEKRETLESIDEIYVYDKDAPAATFSIDGEIDSTFISYGADTSILISNKFYSTAENIIMNVSDNYAYFQYKVNDGSWSEMKKIATNNNFVVINNLNNSDYNTISIKDRAGNEVTYVIRLRMDTVTPIPNVTPQNRDGIDLKNNNTNGLFRFKFTNTASNASGVIYYYRVQGNEEWISVGGDYVDLEIENATIFEYKAVSGAYPAIESNIYTESMNISSQSTVAPIISISQTADGNSYNGDLAAWSNSAQMITTINLSNGDDIAPGVIYQVWYSNINGEDKIQNWETLSSNEIILNSNGYLVCNIRAVSGSGQYSDVHTVYMKQDNTSPAFVTLGLFDPENNESLYDGSWINKTIYLKLEGVKDGSKAPITEYMYRFKGEEYFKPLQIGENGCAILDVDDHLQEIEIYATNSAGVSSSPVSVMFKINKTAPEIPELSIFSGISVTNPTEIVINSYEGVSVSITKSDEKEAGCSVSSKYSLTRPDGTYAIADTNIGIDNGSFNLDSEKINQEGLYILTRSAYDLAGNSSEGEGCFTKLYYDITPPSAPIIQMPSDIYYVGSFLDYKYFTNKNIEIKFISTDATSGVYAFAYIVNGDEKSPVLAESDGTATVTINCADNIKGKIEVFAIDKANNKSEMATSEGLISNQKYSDVTIAPIGSGSTWTKENVSYTIKAIDTESGIKSITCTLNGVPVDLGIAADEFTKGDKLVEEAIKTFTINSETASHLGDEIKVEVTNNAGTKTVTTTKLLIDRTAPEITLSGITPGSFSNTNQTLRISVEEQNFDSNTVTISATREDNGVISNVDLGSFTSTGALSSSDRVFTEDGTYTVRVNSKDAAGNAAAEKQITFTVDKTAPQITLSGAAEGSFSNSNVIAKVGITETNFNSNSVNIKVTKVVDGTSTSFDFGIWSNNAKYSELNRSFTEDGTYTIEATAVDKTGNIAETKKLTFTVDKTAPSISISGSGNYEVSGKAISVVAKVIESYYDTNTVSITMLRTDVNGLRTNLSFGNFNSTSKESSLIRGISEDGIYLITVTSKDKAGNTSTETLNFTIDTLAPVISNLDRYSGKTLKEFSLDGVIKDMISDLTLSSYKIYLNGKEYDGTSVIKENGKYILKIVATDENGLSTTEQTEFIIDSAIPVALFTGINNNEVSNKEVLLNIKLQDNEDTIKAIRINGEEQKLIDGQTTYDFTFDEEGKYIVEVDVEDPSGNEGTSSIAFEYSKTSEAGSEEISNVTTLNNQNSNTIVYIIIFALILAIIIAVIIILLTKNNKKEEK